MAKTATFNSIALGDKVLEGPREVGVRRDIIRQQVSGVDGVTTRNRGGGELRVRVVFVKNTANDGAAQTYVNDTWNACGTAKANLVSTNPWGANRTWTNFLLEEINELSRAGSRITVEATFAGAPSDGP